MLTMSIWIFRHLPFFLLIFCKDSFSRKTAGKHGAKKSSEELAKFKEQVLKEMEEHNNAKVEQVCVEHSPWIESKGDEPTDHQQL